MLESFDFEHEEYGSLAFVEGGEGAFEGEFEREFGFGSELGWCGIFSEALPFAQKVIAAVEENAVDPGGQGGVAFEAADGAVDLDEGFLDRIFGIGAAAGEAKGETFHTAGMEFVKTFKGAQIPAFAGLGEFGVG